LFVFFLSVSLIHTQSIGFLNFFFVPTPARAPPPPPPPPPGNRARRAQVRVHDGRLDVPTESGIDGHASAGSRAVACYRASGARKRRRRADRRGVRRGAAHARAFRSPPAPEHSTNRLEENWCADGGPPPKRESKGREAGPGPFGTRHPAAAIIARQRSREEITPRRSRSVPRNRRDQARRRVRPCCWP
jgi:hypothetical protein